MTFRVIERNGDAFIARWEDPYNDREVQGTCRNGKIAWLARDVVTVRKGHGGHDNSGIIQGEVISMTYAGDAVTNGEPVSGTVTLRLEKETPF